MRFSPGLQQLAERHPWPATRPDVPPKLGARGEFYGWFGGQNRRVLQRLLSEETTCVLELGALLGLSTKYLADYAPNAAIVTIDHWRGSREHQRFEPLADVLGQLYEVFCRHLWEYRHRVIPVRTTTIAGMLSCLSLITPEVVYIDASHETGPVYSDTITALTYWPAAHIVGDDGGWKSIQQALKELGPNTERRIVNHGCCWEIPPKGKLAVGIE